MLKRLNINLSEEQVADVDAYARKLHVNRTAAIAVLLSQALSNDKAIDVLGGLLDAYKQGQE